MDTQNNNRRDSSPYSGAQHYTTIRLLSAGTYGKVDLAVHKSRGKRVILKHLHKHSTRLQEFQREFYVSCQLSVHPAIVVTYDEPFETRESYVFAQEYAPCGDLLDAIPPHQGVEESKAKSCLNQTASALDFLHRRHLVHGNVKPENILVFDRDMNVVKLSDFRKTQRKGSFVKKNCPNVPYTPPELCQAVMNEGYTADICHDVWAFGVLSFCVLTGTFPWDRADNEDRCYREFVNWQKRKTTAISSTWRKFTPRFHRFIRKILEPKTDRRCSVAEISKYIGDTWVKSKGTPACNLVATLEEIDTEDSLNANTNQAAMKELRKMLEDHGVVTDTDNSSKMKRTEQWVDSCFE